MSYLTLAAGIPDFSKAVISLWFRVPMESAIAASIHSMAGIPLPDFPLMPSLLPLLMFGMPQQNKNHVIDFTNVLVGHPDSAVTRYFNSGFHAETAYDVEPCYIAATCVSDGTFDLQFHIQMGDYGSYHSLLWWVTQILYLPDGGCIGPGCVGTHELATIADGSAHIEQAQPEHFHVETDISLEPDKWHHLLLSFDVGGTLSVGDPVGQSTCRMWYAIDDVDYRGPENFQPYRDVGDGLDANAILTRNIYTESGVFTDAEKTFMNYEVSAPAGTYDPSPIPTIGEHFGIPGTTKHNDAIFRVEMAEFQMWTGVTLDTAVLANRRAFVDEDGKPVRPRGTEDDPRAPAEKLLGKKPEILLHGSGNWKTGYNTGTIGVEQNTTGIGEKIPAGQFVPTAKIEPWKPDPSLDGTA